MKRYLLAAVAALAIGLAIHNNQPQHLAPAPVAATFTPAPKPTPPSASEPAQYAPHATLQQQAECKGVAEKYGDWLWDHSGKGFYDSYHVASHMNMKLGVCFALIHQEGDAGQHNSWMLVDAVADRVYADYEWYNFQKKQGWEVKPSGCWSAVGDGTTNYCESEEEFFKAINSYTHD